MIQELYKQKINRVMNNNYSTKYVRLDNNYISFVPKDRIPLSSGGNFNGISQKYSEQIKYIPQLGYTSTIGNQQVPGQMSQIQGQINRNNTRQQNEKSLKMYASLSAQKPAQRIEQNRLRNNPNPETIERISFNPQQPVSNPVAINIMPPQNLTGQIKNYSTNLSKINKKVQQVNSKRTVEEPLILAKSKLNAKDIQQPKLTIEIKAQRSLIRVKEATQIPAMISLKASGGLRTSVDIICVIDNSGSMSGQKIELAKQAIKYVLEFLQESDRLCVITFSDQAVQLCGLNFINNQNKNNISKILQTIEGTYGTNISSGLDLALKVLRERTFVNEATSIFLLSDGQNDSDYQSPKTKFQKDISKPLNRRIGEFTVHSFGFGQDHDEDLMSGISQLKDGNFYYIQQLQTIDEAFCNALGGVASAVASDIKINFNAVSEGIAKGIRIGKTYGKIRVVNEQRGEYLVKLASISSEMSKDFVFELNIPCINVHVKDSERNHQVIKASFSARKLNGQLIMGACSLNITLVNQFQNIPDSVQNADVIENYLRVKTAEEIQKSLKLADERKFQLAQKSLDNMIDQISSNNKARKVKKEELIRDLKQIRSKCAPRQWETDGRKISTNIMSSHTGQSSYAYSNVVQRNYVQTVTSLKSRNF